MMGLASDDRPDPRGVVVLVTELLEHRGGVADSRQGIPELVREHREELVLAAVALLDLTGETAVVERDGGAAPQGADELDVGPGGAAAPNEHPESHGAPPRAPGGRRRPQRPPPPA